MASIFTDPDTFVDDALAGFVLAHRGEVRRVDGGVVRARPLRPGQVAVVIGGGSGHYPAFAGFVGHGLASGAVCGNVFTSPSAGQAMRVAQAVENGGGVLFTFGRYAGDVLHFGEAQRRLREDGVDARTVLITDDVASAPEDRAGERRGIAGIVFVFRVAGAAAERGDSLDEVERLAALANSRGRSHGVAFAGCVLPGASEPLFTVPEGMMSVGLGIHGEPGVRDVPLQEPAELAETLLAPLLQERPGGATRAALIVNGLGAVKYEELFILFGHVARQLEQRGVEIVAPECGELVTSLDMAGVSVSLLWLDDELEELWTQPTAAPAFTRGSVDLTGVDAAPSEQAAPLRTATQPVAEQTATPASIAAVSVARSLIRAAHNIVHDNAQQLGDLDAIAGDGDHGIGMVRGLAAALEFADTFEDAGGIRHLARGAGDAWSEAAGGTSGALWGAGIAAFGDELGDRDSYDLAAIARAITAARRRIVELGGAAIGDKTMLDAIVPFETAFLEQVERGSDAPTAVRLAADAATAAAQSTAELSPKLGRARPLAARSVGHPDPGAVSFSLIVQSVSATLEHETGE